VLGTYEGARVIAPGTHDTASAVAATPLQQDDAYLSSGTWSLVGLEVESPVLTEEARLANVTNEGGVGGRIRLLKNVMGLWLVQQARLKTSHSYAELAQLAEDAPPHTAVIDPDDARFLRTGDIASDVADYCRESGQPPPPDTGTLIRVILESLARKYATVLRQLQDVSGQTVRRLHIVGGGANNALLCQLTADATGLAVQAGLTEATAVGNVLVQMLALGEVGSLREARELVQRSFSSRCFQPRETYWR
jgi:rhamnulokinase